MDTNKIDDVIPEQETGSKTDVHHSVTANSLQEGIELFNLAKERLQDVNHWHTFCGKASAVFQLTDANGNNLERKAQKGDHFKINIPAPGTDSGQGYDWVEIEAVEEKGDSSATEQSFAIRVRPTENPQSPGEDVAHFFKENATSSFAVQREGNKVTASVHGRNELPNTETKGLLDKARNAVVALGAMIGFSNPQWKSLVNGLLEK